MPGAIIARIWWGICAVMRCDPYLRCALALMVGFVAAAAVFSLWPGFDLWVSGLFFRQDGGFWLAQVQVLEQLRHFIWGLSLLAVAMSVLGVVLLGAGRTLWGLTRRGWLFVLLLYVVGPGLIVNAILKSYWGRARPAMVQDFGGPSRFTMALSPTDQCDANCSFVSGEGAAATALALVAWLLMPRVAAVVGAGAARVIFSAALGICSAGIGLRVMTGRHFLSDTVFAVLIVLTVALVLHVWLLRPARAACSAGLVKETDRGGC